MWFERCFLGMVRWNLLHRRQCHPRLMKYKTNTFNKLYSTNFG